MTIISKIELHRILPHFLFEVMYSILVIVCNDFGYPPPWSLFGL